jgi:hypothetical protein
MYTTRTCCITIPLKQLHFRLVRSTLISYFTSLPTNNHSGMNSKNALRVFDIWRSFHIRKNVDYKFRVFRLVFSQIQVLPVFTSFVQYCIRNIIYCTVCLYLLYTEYNTLYCMFIFLLVGRKYLGVSSKILFRCNRVGNLYN